MPTIDDAIEQLREAIKADLYELPDTDAEPSYDEDHDGVELIVHLIDAEDRQNGEVLHIELYEGGDGADVAVDLNLDDARRVHAALTAILKAA